MSSTELSYQKSSFLVISHSFRWFNTEKCLNKRAIMRSPSLQHNNDQPNHRSKHLNRKAAPMAAITLDTEASLTFPMNIKNELDKSRLGSNAFCCCGSVQFRHVALWISIFELLVFGYQIIVSFYELFITPIATNDPTIPGDLHKPFLPYQLLTLLFLLLSIIAIVLLMIGVIKRSPYLLLPHLLIQFTLLTANFLIAAYVAIWLLGGINFRVNAIFSEQSFNGEQFVERALHRPPIMEANFTVTQMQLGLVAILILLLLAIFIQLWLFHIIFCTFRYLDFLASEKNTKLPRIRNGSIPAGARKATKREDLNSSSDGQLSPRISVHSPQTETSSPNLVNTNTTSTAANTTTSSATSSPPPPPFGGNQPANGKQKEQHPTTSNSRTEIQV